MEFYVDIKRVLVFHLTGFGIEPSRSLDSFWLFLPSLPPVQILMAEKRAMIIEEFIGSLVYCVVFSCISIFV